jgi:hypothetical protein
VVIVTVRSLLIGAAVLSVAALVPAALAAERPDDAAGPIGVGGIAQAQAPAATRPDDRAERFTPGAATPVVVRPDDRAERFTPGAATPVVVRPDDRAERFTPGAAEPAVADESATTSRFEWSDPAVIGGLAALAAAIATAFALVHRRGGSGTTGPPGSPAPTH